jgi:hypothetical protein
MDVLVDDSPFPCRTHIGDLAADGVPGVRRLAQGPGVLRDKGGVIGCVAGPHLPLLVRPGRQLLGRIPPRQLVQHVPAVLVTPQQDAVPQRQQLR